MDEKCIYTYFVGDPIRSFGNATKEPRSVIFGRCQCHVPRRADHWSMQVGVEYSVSGKMWVYRYKNRKMFVKSAVDLGTWKGAKQVHAESACNYGAVVLNITYPVT